MVLHAYFRNVNMLLNDFIELFCGNLQQMIVLLDPAFDGLFVIIEMFHQIGKVVYSGVVYGEHIFELCADIFVDSFANKAQEHIWLNFALSILENYIGMAVCLSEYKSFDYVSYFSFTSTCDNYKLVSLLLFWYDFEL